MYPEVGLLDHIVLFLIFAIVVTLIYILLNNIQTFPFSLLAYQHLVSFDFLIMALMIGDIEHSLIYLLTIYMFYFEECLFRFFAYFYFIFKILFSTSVYIQ